MRFSRYLLIVSVFIAIVSLSIVADAQILDPSPFGGKYTAKIGDKQYRITNLYFNTLYHHQGAFLLPNGSIFSFNETQNTYFTVVVVNKNKTLFFGIPQIYLKVTISDPSTNYSQSIMINSTSFISFGFQNVDYVKGYLEALPHSYPTHSNNNSLSEFNQSLTVLGINNDNYTLFNNKSIGKQTITNTVVYNWRTGWLQSDELLNKFNNGTIISHIQMIRLHNNNSFLPGIFEFSKSLFIVSFITFVIFLCILIVSYLSYTRNVEKKENLTYKKFLQKKMKIKSKNKRKFEIHIDKSLELIEEIINESKE